MRTLGSAIAASACLVARAHCRIAVLLAITTDTVQRAGTGIAVLLAAAAFTLKGADSGVTDLLATAALTVEGTVSAVADLITAPGGAAIKSAVAVGTGLLAIPTGTGKIAATATSGDGLFQLNVAVISTASDNHGCSKQHCDE